MGECHLITCEYPPQIGGVSSYSWSLAGGLARAGHSVHVWYRPTSGDPPIASGVTIHPELGKVTPADLRRVDRLLNQFTAPRRLLVQWVPHGFGYQSMNVLFCWWLRSRARAGDCVEVMVHEPYVEFGRSLKQSAMASVHRLMTIVLLAAATRVWLATPTWERLLRPYALGRQVPFQWLPISSDVSSDPVLVAKIRQRSVGNGRVLVGHFGIYTAAISQLLCERLPMIVASRLKPSVLLVGEGAERFRRDVVAMHPDLAEGLHVPGMVPDSELGSYLSACDLLVQPYPDGITARRTTAIAGMALSRAIVTTAGHLTETLWAESRAVALADVADPVGFAAEAERLLNDDGERQRVGARAQALYNEYFALRHAVAALAANQTPS